LDLYAEDRRTVIFVTHDMDEALLTGDFIYVYGSRPMRLQNKFSLADIKEDRRERKLYGDTLTAVKNEIYKETEKWQVKK
jgi:NitT/TauT family transport system ATP-binding protein